MILVVTFIWVTNVPFYRVSVKKYAAILAMQFGKLLVNVEKKRL